jgi:glycerate kinase
MKIVIAIDSFKGSLSSLEAGNAVAVGIKRVYKDADITVRPIADGGEGTVEAVVSALGGKLCSVKVSDPLCRPIMSQYGIVGDTAFIEMAAASGITLISVSERNPMHTTTYGVGELIKDAIQKGIRDFVIGIGGSATNDGGIGMLSALGFEFLDTNGKDVSLGAKGLENLSEIRTDKALEELKNCTFKVACDVNNPLCGEKGCSAVFAPQKGATPEMIKDMDGWLKSYAKIAKTVSDRADENLPGAGAAGGLGFAFATFLNSELKSGIKIVLEETKLEAYLKDADIVVTGEGRLDSQTVMGKAPIGVAGLAKKYGKRVIAFSGCVTEDAEVINDHGIDAFFPILRGVTTLEDALNLENAYKNLTATAYQVFRLIV